MSLRVMVAPLADDEELLFHLLTRTGSSKQSAVMEALDDERLVLDDVLAFIETSSLDLSICCAVGDDSILLPLLPFEDEELFGNRATTSLTTGASDIEAKAQPDVKRQKKVYVRRDPRKEIAALQAEAEQLDERLTLLRRRQSAMTRVFPYQHRQVTVRKAIKDTMRPRTLGTQAWMDKALEEIAKREQSEQMNAYLKGALTKKLRVSKALGCLLHDHDMDASVSLSRLLLRMLALVWRSY